MVNISSFDTILIEMIDKNMCSYLLFKMLVRALKTAVPECLSNSVLSLEHKGSKATQDYEEIESKFPLTKAVPKVVALQQVRILLSQI